MGSLKEVALEYESSTTGNVADLDVFDVNMELLTYEGEDSDGRAFKYKYVEDKDGLRYRVPWPVIAQIKDYLEEEPDQSLFKVKKTGQGKQTRYTVIPVLEKKKVKGGE